MQQSPAVRHRGPVQLAPVCRAAMDQLATQGVDPVEHQPVQGEFRPAVIQVLASLGRHVVPAVVLGVPGIEPAPEVVVEVDVVEEALAESPFPLEELPELIVAVEFEDASQEVPDAADVPGGVVGLLVPQSVERVEADPEEDQLVIDRVGAIGAGDVLRTPQPRARPVQADREGHAPGLFATDQAVPPLLVLVGGGEVGVDAGLEVGHRLMMLPASEYAACSGTKGRLLGGMSFTAEELECLETHAVGWEAVLDRLWVALDERLHGMILNGSPGDWEQWSLRSRFLFLGDVDRAQDFIGVFIDGLMRKGRAQTLLHGFEREADKVLAYLAAPDLVQKRALSYHAKAGRCGVTGMSSDPERVGRARNIDADGGVGETLEARSPNRPGGGIDLASLPIQICWEPEAGIDAKVRMASLQCWPRLDRGQPGMTVLEEDLKQVVQSSSDLSAFEALVEQHDLARRRLADEIAEIDRQIEASPGMHRETREQHESRRTGFEADRLLCPLNREQAQSLLGLATPDAAYQQISRYRRAYADLFPDLLQHFEDRMANS